MIHAAKNGFIYVIDREDGKLISAEKLGTVTWAGVVSGGTAPDLRASPVPLSAEAFNHIVHDGALVARGMPQFAELSDEQLDSIRHFLRQQARDALAAQATPPAAAHD